VFYLLRYGDNEIRYIYTKEQKGLPVQLIAIAHPVRISILQERIKVRVCTCGDLVSELGFAQATISQHLQELKNAGIIQETIEGTSVYYRIEPKEWKIQQDGLKVLLLKKKESNKMAVNCVSTDKMHKTIIIKQTESPGTIQTKTYTVTVNYIKHTEEEIRIKRAIIEQIIKKP